ncbi:MAG: alpha/beta fold hydrolase [Acidimicrobiales bacterium]
MLRSFGEGLMFGSTFGGASPKVLALHGWARTHRDFNPVLSSEHGTAIDAVAVDLPGFGSSPPPPEPWSTDRYAEALGAVTAQMDAPIVVLGHSFGGRIAVRLAASAPELVSALVLTGVPLVRLVERPRVPSAFRAAKGLERIGLLSQARLERLRRRYGSSDYANANGVMRDVLVRIVNETYDESLGALRCPVTLVWGEDDAVAPLAVARAAADFLGRSRLVVVPRAGHLTPLSAPEALRVAVLELLGGR